MIRELVIHPDKRLSTPCQPVFSFDKSLHQLVEDLFDTMYRYDGIGLAAPQIGDSRKVFVMDVRDGKKPHNPIAFINPELLAMTGSAEDEEGCLSMPGVFLQVRRATYLHFSAQTYVGTHHGATLRGLEARVWLHEWDHTMGIMFSHRATVDNPASVGV